MALKGLKLQFFKLIRHTTEEPNFYIFKGLSSIHHTSVLWTSSVQTAKFVGLDLANSGSRLKRRGFTKSVNDGGDLA